MEIDRPEVVAEVTAAFHRYEAALVANDVAVLTALFWDDARVLRYGVADAQRGPAALSAFRARGPSAVPGRLLARVAITTFGRDFGVASAEFGADGTPGVGRQTQSWVRAESGWRIVAAHVSVVPRHED